MARRDTSTTIHHWSPTVREKAAAAASAITKRWVAPAPINCDSSLKEVPPGWETAIDGQPVHLAPVERARWAGSLPSICGAQDVRHLSLVALVDGACLLGFDRGEFGGSIVVVDNGRTQTLRETWYTNPIRTIDLRGSHLLLEGLEHLTGSWGYLTRVVRGTDGGWRAEIVTRLPGAPIAYGFDHAGRLVIAARSPEWDRCGGIGGELARKVRAFVIDDAGRIEAIP
jgi:hypothetical protein